MPPRYPPDLIKTVLEKAGHFDQALCIVAATVDIDDGFKIADKLIIVRRDNIVHRILFLFEWCGI
jgi:hypothetical protein